jgi:hypothetical protein
MSMYLFREILEKVSDEPSLQYCTFNAYNEPALDPLFEDRIRALAKTKLKLNLYTNGSAIKMRHLRLFKKLGVLNAIVFNLPTLDPELHRTFTGAKGFKKCVKALDEAITLELPVNLAVQGTEEELRKNLPKIHQRYPQIMRGRHLSPPSNCSDRCGVLKNHYGRFLRTNRPRLYGCIVPEQWLYVSVTGKLFLCCEDFYQKSVYGDIRDGSLEQIMATPRARRMFNYVEGKTPAPDDFVCRNCVLMVRKGAL